MRVSRLAAMAADCKSAGLSIVGSSPTWPTKRNRAASLWKPPNIFIIPYGNAPVNLRIFQTFLLSFIEHPILHFLRPSCIMKIQKRSESNVLSKLSINKSIESKRLRKWLIPSTIDDPWSWVNKRSRVISFVYSTSHKGRFFLHYFLEKILEINF